MKRKTVYKERIFGLYFFVFITNLLLGTSIIAQSTKEYKTATDTLVVYSDVPSLTPSDKFTIRVRSAATNNEWVQCFANYTYNRWHDFPTPATVGGNVYGYITHVKGWSHTYANVEMSENSPIEVEISKIGDALLDGVSVIDKSAVHPSHKVFDKRDENGKVYFKLNKPCQVVIDINGQMDDHNTGYAEHAQIGAVHAISFFANPVIKKPAATDPGVLYVTAGTVPDMNATYSTMVFGPGVHDIGAGFKIFAQRSYYIPGDAIVYGSLTNSGTSVAGVKNGDGISISGYGTLSGVKIPHYQNPVGSDAIYYPTYNGGAQIAITIENAINVKIHGITVVDAANFCGMAAFNQNSIMSWFKAIAWRVNSDGFGLEQTTDCFYRVSDNVLSIGNRKRITFWKDTNASILQIRNLSPGDKYLMEDCDILYHRRRTGATGKVWPLNQAEYLQFQKQITVDITLKDIRFHDKKADMPIFALNSDGISYRGLKFENISCNTLITTAKNQILGTAATPWDRGVEFINVTFNHNNGQAPVLLTQDNFNTYFDTNEFAKDLWFRKPNYFNITKKANPSQGKITLKTDDQISVSVDTSYIEKSTVTLTATALPGYEFAGWSGDTIATSNPLLLKMNANKTISANFNALGTKTLTATTPLNGTIAISPAGASQTTNSIVTLTAKPAVGYKFDSWSGDVAGNSIVTKLKMDADKTISANFVKTNSFAFNCGGDQYIAADGTVFAQTPNGSFNTTATITNTNDQFLYKSEKSGKTFSYDLPVDNGNYTVTLKFAEIFWQAAGKRVFNVSIEGTPVLSNFDIFAEAGGRYKALDKTFNTIVADSVLNIAFTTTLDNAKISAIKIANDKETSVSETSLKTSISIYPNPATDKLFFNSADKLISKIELVDLTGKIVFSANLQAQNGSVDLKGMVKGMYIVRIHAENNIVTNKISVK